MQLLSWRVFWVDAKPHQSIYESYWDVAKVTRLVLYSQSTFLYVHLLYFRGGSSTNYHGTYCTYRTISSGTACHILTSEAPFSESTLHNRLQV